MKITKSKLFLLPTLLLSLSACGEQGSNGSNVAIDPKKEDYYQTLESRVELDKQCELNFHEDFEDGMSDDIWYTLDGSWHTNESGWEHNGMNSQNLFYTKDANNNSYLAIRGRGWYNKETENNKPDGGCIITKEHYGPGRYEIKMAVMPREGAVSTMWTYCTKTGNENTSQNEIDIEIGGTSSSGTHFEEMWATTWTTHTIKETDKVDVTDQFYMNDGKIHTYTFDWYTSFPTTNEPRIEWFVDGKFVNAIDGGAVPIAEMPIWVGLWFPPAWCGNPRFVEDYMLVDSVSYQAFTFNSQYYDDCRAEPGYIKKVPSQANIKTIPFSQIENVNKFAGNKNFDTLDICPRDRSYYGWFVEEGSKGSIALSDDKQNGSKAFLLKAGEDDGSSYHGQYLYQDLTDAYQGFKYLLKVNAKLVDENSSGNVEIYFKNKAGKKFDKTIIPVTSLNYQLIEQEIVMKEGATSLQVVLTAENGSVLYDSIDLTFVR